MQFVEGCSLDDLFIKLYSTQPHSQTRQELLVFLQEAYVKMGEGLSEFHNQKRDFEQPIPLSIFLKLKHR